MEADLTLEAVVNFLLETPLFDAMSSAELAEIVRIMQIQSFREGATVFREGDAGDAWYVVYSGDVEVHKSGGFAPPKVVAKLDAHACFGEMAILDDSPRSATIKAANRVSTFRFPRDAYLDLLEGGSLAAYKLVLAMAKVLCQRQRALTAQLAEQEGDDVSISDDLGALLGEFAVVD